MDHRGNGAVPHLARQPVRAQHVLLDHARAARHGHRRFGGWQARGLPAGRWQRPRAGARTPWADGFHPLLHLLEPRKIHRRHRGEPQVLQKALHRRVPGKAAHAGEDLYAPGRLRAANQCGGSGKTARRTKKSRRLSRFGGAHRRLQRLFHQPFAANAGGSAAAHGTRIVRRTAKKRQGRLSATSRGSPLSMEAPCASPSNRKYCKGS